MLERDSFVILPRKPDVALWSATLLLLCYFEGGVLVAFQKREIDHLRFATSSSGVLVKQQLMSSLGRIVSGSRVGAAAVLP